MQGEVGEGGEERGGGVGRNPTALPGGQPHEEVSPAVSQVVRRQERGGGRRSRRRRGGVGHADGVEAEGIWEGRGERSGGARRARPSDEGQTRSHTRRGHGGRGSG